MSIWERLGGIQGKAATLLIVVFLAGGGTGYFAGRWQGLRHSLEAGPRPPFVPSRRVRDHFLRKLENDLQLEPTQLERVRATLREKHQKMRQIRRRMRPEVESLLQEAQREIRVLLNDDQKGRFDQMVKEFKERRRRKAERYRRREKIDR